jgi:ATP-binding cassette subfamily B protein
MGALLNARREDGPGRIVSQLTLGDAARRFWPYLRPYRRTLAIVLALAVIGPALEAVTIWMTKVVVDRVVVPHDLAALLPVGALFAAFTIFLSLAEFADDYLASSVAERFLLDLRTSVFSHLHRLSPSFFEGNRLGDVISRLTGDIAAIETLMLSGVADGLTYVIRIALFGGALFLLSWPLALAAIVVAPLFWAATRHFSAEIKLASRAKRRQAGAVSAVAEESLANAAVVQAYGREADEVSRIADHGRRAMNAELDAARLRGLFSSITDLLELVGGLLVIGIGSWQVANGHLSIGGFVAFLAYLTQLYSPVRRLGKLMSSLHAASASAERIAELLDERPLVTDPAVVTGPSPVTEPLPADGPVTLAFDDVSFRYPGVRVSALQRFSLTVVPGESVGIVGASGAGKSTLAKLALRFYDPAEGRITLGDTDLRDLTLERLRSRVALLLQETLVFHGTIEENIAFGRPCATAEQVRRAALAAGAHAFIAELPDGYDTVVGHNGRRLSGGQRQRIAIARAMVKDAPVLILDEPTTGLDVASARDLLEPLRRLMRGRTVLVISHDLRAIRDLDRIVVVAGGRIAEEGSHEELIVAGGEYARMWALNEVLERSSSSQTTATADDRVLA